MAEALTCFFNAGATLLALALVVDADPTARLRKNPPDEDADDVVKETPATDATRASNRATRKRLIARCVISFGAEPK